MANGSAALQLTDDQFMPDHRGSIDASVGAIGPALSFEKFARHYETPTAAWQVDIVRQLLRLRELPRGWDGYGAPPLSPDAAWFTIELLGKIMRPRTPVPHVVPSSVGGIQIEWHEKDIDLEIHIAAPYQCELWYKDHRSGNLVSEEFTGDFSILANPVAELSQR